MIFDFALEPELVARWHDRRVAYPILCQLGPGQCRVPCAYPSAAWPKMVMNALRELVPPSEGARFQAARKNLDILLRHLKEIGTQRNGRMQDGQKWLDAALAEHAAFPFGGILVWSLASAGPEVVVADRLGEHEFPAWTPPAPPVARTARDLATAMAPLLRCASELRFVDPYFDAEDSTFYDPMELYLRVAQRRRSIGELRLQLHFWVRAGDARAAGQTKTRSLVDVARDRVEACKRRLGPLLRPKVVLNVVAWGQGKTGRNMHNRYVLAKFGGIAAQTGLDSARRNIGQTDDLTLLSKGQRQERWREFALESAVYEKLADACIVGSEATDG